MVEWLLAPVDAARAHEVGAAVAWHGRLMVAAWGFLLPLGVLVARFFKITPSQDWPRRIDNRLWWNAHLALQYAGGAAMLAGLALVLSQAGGGARWSAHGLLGYAVLLLGLVQFLGGWLRGSKGGPTEPSVRG
ncbi:MAG: cytochrome b561 domain-containing protein, partial [Beijerinckiaceae bacterium]